MYIIEDTYGGFDWHDSKTVFKQLKDEGSYDISENRVNQIIAERIAESYSSIDNIREKIIQAISEESTLVLVESNSDWKIELNKEAHEAGQTFAAFDGKELKLTEEYIGGQISYTTYFTVLDIPDDKVCYVVTEDFLAPMKGCPVVQRLLHDVFNDLHEAESYMENFEKHDLPYCDSTKTFLIQNKDLLFEKEWYRKEKEALDLMAEKNQTCYDDSFRIFAEQHIEALKKCKQEGE